MGILGTIFGGTTAQPVEAVGRVVDQLFTSDDEKLSRQETLARLAMQAQLAQTEVNKLEAQNSNMFVAGWRPAIGWVCALGLLFPFIINPCIQWYMGRPGPELPLEALNELIWAILGLGAYRSVEKVAGRAK